MQQVIIENPVLNSPFEEATKHFRFSEEGITNEIVETRRISSYFIPIAKPKKKGKAAQLNWHLIPSGLETVLKKMFSSTVSETGFLCGGRETTKESLRQLADFWNTGPILSERRSCSFVRLKLQKQLST